MLKSMIRTIDSWRFELPLALALGAAAAFASIAAPPQLFGAQAGEIVTTLIQSAVAALVALVASGIAYFAMRRPHVPTEVIIADDDEEFEAPSVTAERLVRLRRADAHPDAPPRQPIRASRDLGEPFMDVAGFPAPPAPLVDLVVPPAVPIPVVPIPDADYVEIDPPVAEQPAAEPVAEEPVSEAPIAAQPEIEMPAEPFVEAAPEPVVAEAPVPADQPWPIEAFEPEPEPAPAPSRMPRQSLSSMMERLSAGLERRNGEPMAPPPAAAVAEALSGPRDVKPELRNALDQLNRLAARRD
jgi:hypothetical protein